MSFDTTDLRYCPSCGDQRWTEEHLASINPKICRECGYTEKKCADCGEFFSPEERDQTTCESCMLTAAAHYAAHHDGALGNGSYPKLP